jgi:hypothetical protein
VPIVGGWTLIVAGPVFREQVTLFTLLGTVAGAYFGIKSSSDTADRAKKQVDEASARTERANRSAKSALLEVDPNKSQEFRARGLV